MSRNRYLRQRHSRPHGAEPDPWKDTSYVPRTESEEARRAARDFLRERDESNAPDWDEGETEVFV